jgi:prophage DNA circulation protein
MAKRQKQEGHELPGGRSNSSQSTLEDFAEDLGRLLGTARTKAEGWLNQRQNVAKQLEQIRDTAAGLLNQLTGVPERRRRGRARTPQPVVPLGTLPGKKPRRKLSVKARAAISRAQKKRWAKLRKEQE